MKRLLLILSVLVPVSAAAQQPSLSIVAGRAVEEHTNSPLSGLTAILETIDDSIQVAAGTSNADGYFALRIRQRGTYRLKLMFLGFLPHERQVAVDSAYKSLGTIAMHQDILKMDEIVVEHTQERMIIRGDTTIFNADAYKVNPDASAEDLIAKMPGVTVQDGQVEAQGEQVQRVTVDGREFFGNDPTAALRNLPADVIQAVEVFDRESDQAQFTGFSDGNQEKTINIITRTGMSNGQFGKVYGGYGDEARYITGGNTNIFDGDRRISIIGLSNNVNQQNFASQDLLGLMGGGGRGGFRGGGGMRGGSAGMRGGGGSRGGGGTRGGGRGGFDPRSFLVGQQGGLNTTSSVGVNYSDEFGEGVRVSSSYFFNRTSNQNDSFLDRQLFLDGQQTQFFDQTTQSTSKNFNHRLNARIDYRINENNSLMIRPSLSFQNNEASSFDEQANTLDTGRPLNEVQNNYSSDNFGYTSSTSILYRHRFPTPGRTVSADVRIGMNNRWGDTDQLSITEFYEQTRGAGGGFRGAGGGTALQDSTYDQEIDSESAGQSYSMRLAFTETLGEVNQLQLTYRPSYGRNVSDRSAYVLDLRTGQYTILDPTFSSLFDNDVVQQRGGVSFRRDIEDKFELQLGLEVQNERLLGDQTYPSAFKIDRSFLSFLPEAEIEFEFGEALDLDIDYRTRTNTPSVNQLQDVIDNTNPTFLSSGNPNLEPSYAHSISLRGRRGNWRAGRMMFAYVNLTRETNSIGTASLVAQRDTMIAERVLLPVGGQFSYPVNLDEPSINVRSFVGMGTPFPLLKSNLNFRGGVTYSRTPALINGTSNMSTQYAFRGGLTLGSNISERVDFTITYNADYTIADNSYYTVLDEDYYRHDTGVRFTWLPIGGLVFENSLTYNDYLGLDETLYPTTFIVNAGLGYKFLQQDAAELKLVVGDIFNQETGIRRSITESYIEDSSTQVLGRYILLNLSYRFRNFGL